MARRKKFNLKDTEIAKRSDAYSMNPRDINVDFSTNPRIDYGDEDFLELKESIKINGLIQPLTVYIDQRDGKVHLAHGFRRMKAILELISEGLSELTSVKVITVENNIETILIHHFVQNTGKKLSDLELGETLLRLYNIMGEGSAKEISEKTGIGYQKVLNLISFAKKGSTKIKNAVKEKVLSMSNAIAIADTADSVTHQNEVLEEAETKMKESGTKKIKPAHISILEARMNKNGSGSILGVLRNMIEVVMTSDKEDMDKEFAERLEYILDGIEDKDLSERDIINTFFTKETA